MREHRSVLPSEADNKDGVPVDRSDLNLSVLGNRDAVGAFGGPDLSSDLDEAGWVQRSDDRCGSPNEALCASAARTAERSPEQQNVEPC